MWTFREDEEFAEMMEDYPRVEPAIERIVTLDAEQERIHRAVQTLEKRVKRLERADK